MQSVLYLRCKVNIAFNSREAIIMRRCNRELKTEFKIGLLTFALYIILYRFTNTHESILGLIFGISIGAYIIGFLPQNIKTKIKTFKKSLLGNR